MNVDKVIHLVSLLARSLDVILVTTIVSKFFECQSFWFCYCGSSSILYSSIDKSSILLRVSGNMPLSGMVTLTCFTILEGTGRLHSRGTGSLNK